MNAEERRWEEAVEVARGHIHAFLAAALADPMGRHFEMALDKKIQTVAVAAADLLAGEAPEAMELAPCERPPELLDLRPVAEELALAREEILRQHQEVFGLLIGKSTPPYETEYCHSTLTFYRTQQLADIAGFYRAFGLEPNREEAERQDHVSAELEFMARLIEKELAAATPEQAEICREAQKKFLADHLAWWAPAFAAALRRAAPGGLYGALASALASFLAGERALLSVRPAGQLAEPKPAVAGGKDESCCELADACAGSGVVQLS